MADETPEMTRMLPKATRAIAAAAMPEMGG